MKIITVIVFSLICAVLGDESAKYDTIVIGAGSAGVTAGTYLARAGRHVLLLEAQDRIGGRVFTKPFGDGLVEVGAEWIHGTNHHPGYDLALQNNLTIIDQESKDIVLYSTDSLAQTERDDILEIMENCLDYKSYELPKVTESLGDYMTKQVKEYIEKHKPDLNKKPDDVKRILDSFNNMMKSLNGCDDWSQLSAWSEDEDLGGSMYASFGRLGYQTFFKLLLNTFGNGTGTPNLDIKLNTEVTNIKWSPEGGSVTVTTADGTKYEAENVIVTVSLGVLKEKYQTLFTPELPAEKIDAIQNMSMGVLGKLILSFSEAWWPKDQYPYVYLWSDEDKKVFEDDWVRNIASSSTPAGASNVITLWVSGAAAIKTETLPDEEIKTKTTQLLRHFMGKNVTIPDATGIIKSTWHSNPYTRGSYTYDNVHVPEHSNWRYDLGKPLLDAEGKPRVLFAGEATQPKFFGTVHGASFSGKREAQRILGEDVNSKE